jgi:inward rectifier potassium channel
MAGRTRPNPSQRLRLGAYEMVKIGAKRFDWSDPYHFALTISWPVFFADLVVAYLVIASVFAVVYFLNPGAIANVHPGSWPDALFFSFETMAGAGYGEMYPLTLPGRLVAAAEIITGMAFTAIMTGLVFVRFSKPRPKILFAEKLVIAQHNGLPTLIVRVGNGRVHALTDASSHVVILVKEITREGAIFYNTHDLGLLRSKTPAFPLVVSLMHPIDERSPLHGLDADDMVERELRLFVTFEARDPQLGATVSDLKAYGPEDIAWGMRYCDMISKDEKGRNVADLTRLSMLEPDPASKAPPPPPEDVLP